MILVNDEERPELAGKTVHELLYGSDILVHVVRFVIPLAQEPRTEGAKQLRAADDATAPPAAATGSGSVDVTMPDASVAAAAEPAPVAQPLVPAATVGGPSGSGSADAGAPPPSLTCSDCDVRLLRSEALVVQADVMPWQGRNDVRCRACAVEGGWVKEDDDFKKVAKHSWAVRRALHEDYKQRQRTATFDSALTKFREKHPELAWRAKEGRDIFKQMLIDVVTSIVKLQEAACEVRRHPRSHLPHLAAREVPRPAAVGGPPPPVPVLPMRWGRPPRPAGRRAEARRILSGACPGSLT